VTIPTFTEKYIDKKAITFYNVEVFNNFSKQKWTMEKRYSEFENMRASLSKLLTNLPTLPGKTVFKLSSFDDISKRKGQLEQFLKDCVARKDILNSEEFKDFIEISKNSPELSVNEPQQISKHADFLPLGIRDFQYLKYENVFLIACSEMNLASRVDTIFTNMNFPWEKKSDAHVSMGAVFAFKAQTDSGGSYNFDKLWAKSFPIQVR
jgi:hypothetical protein